MNDFARLRKNTSIEKLQKALDSQKGGYPRDERFWKLTTDKANNGWAEIRFLPAPPGEDEDFVVRFKHFFKGPSGKIYSEFNRTTLGRNEADPVNEFNKQLYAQFEQTGDKSIKTQVSKQKRKLKFVSNILVVNDPAHPENNGKVFLFEYGKKIMDKIKVAAGVVENVDETSEIPEDEEVVTFNAFNLWEGANFKLKCRDVEDYPNYDLSIWKKQSPVANTDDEIEKIWRSEHSLKALLDPKNFETYDVLKQRLQDVLEVKAVPSNTSPLARTAPQPTAAEVQEPDDDVPTTQQADAEIAAATSESDGDEDDDQEFARFRQLSKM